MKITYKQLPVSHKFVLYLNNIPWAVRDSLVELVVIANDIYRSAKC